MAKKEKEKKQKQKKGKRAKKEKDVFEMNAPYAGSDKVRGFLARLLIVLSLIFLGIIIYTIHYMRYTARDSAIYPVVYEVAAELPAAEGAPYEPQ